MSLARGHAAGLDAGDPLRRFRDRFSIDDDVVYQDGNPLGWLPRSTLERLASVASEQWDRGWSAPGKRAGWSCRALPISLGR